MKTSANFTKEIRSITLTVLSAFVFFSGNLYSAESKLYGSFLMNVTDINTLPDHSSLTGKYLVGLVLPMGKTPFYCSVIARQGSSENTYQIGIRTTKFNEGIFCEMNISVNDPCTVAFSVETGDVKHSIVSKLWLNPKMFEPEPEEDLSQYSDKFPFSVLDLLLDVSSQLPASVSISDAHTSFAWEQIPLPVELVSFTPIIKQRSVELVWKTATEVNNYGFEIERKSTIPVLQSPKNDDKEEWENIAFMEGHGTTNKQNEYSYVDENVYDGKYLYRLKQIDHDGKFSYSHTVEVTVDQTVQGFSLDQNYPNPFNPSTTVRFHAAERSTVKLTIYNSLGQQVEQFIETALHAGNYEHTFNASKLSSGIYLCRIEAVSEQNPNNIFLDTKKMLLLR